VATTPSTPRLDAPATTLVFDLDGGHAGLAYLGPPLPAGEPIAALCAGLRRGAHECEPDLPVPRSILPLGHTGYPGRPVLEICRQGRLLGVGPQAVIARGSGAALHFSLEDATQGLRIDSRWQARDSGVVVVEQAVTVDRVEALQLLRFASLVLPLPGWVTAVTHYAGRWSAEMHASRTVLAGAPGLGGASRGGRPGFGGGQWLVFDGAGTTEHTGPCLAVHLAWSGDHAWHVDTHQDGDAVLWIGAALEPGEVEVAAGARFEAPPAVLAFSTRGRAGLRHALHRHVSREVLPEVGRATPRRVHLNTWEACGFSLSMPRLERLAEDAAALGVERFVLDDGWFGRRRDDRSSLGDWQPSAEVFPQGLDPLIRHVQRLGMDFGLWVEPEMVSPDSELYRRHPDWCLALDGLPRATQRHQLVLDLARPEVAAYLFDALDGLLRRHAIAALKWDHNRELFPRAGRGLTQTLALYRLLDRLRAAHPAVEIESCASGGGRVDYSILARCTRFWASDNNDPIERLRINRSWLQFLPLRTCGHHVGPSPNPVTGRALPMDFRAKVALFGHMGVEADPGSMTPDERRTLAAHVALYRQWRDVLHEGELGELAVDDPGVCGWVAVAGPRALALVAQTAFARHFEVAPVRIPGLDPARLYRVTLPEPWPDPAARYLGDSALWRDGLVISGAALAHAGLALPLRHPCTAWLIALEAE
jgi:alpha-galactosidase